jgi:hypothetical protein
MRHPLLVCCFPVHLSITLSHCGQPKEETEGVPLCIQFREFKYSSRCFLKNGNAVFANRRSWFLCTTAIYCRRPYAGRYHTPVAIQKANVSLKHAEYRLGSIEQLLTLPLSHRWLFVFIDPVAGKGW